MRSREPERKSFRDNGFHSVAALLLPRLPHRTSATSRMGLVAVVVLLAVFVLLRWAPPLIGISALGIPLVFVLQLTEEDGFRRLSRRALVGAALLGIGAGVLWARATDAIWALTYDDVLATPMTTAQALVNYVAIPVVGLALMLLPVIVLRWRRVGIGKPLHGFAFGALGALCFTSAGFLTQAASEFENGLVSREFPLDAFVAVAGISGIAAPMTSAALGGMVGATLWRRADSAAESRSWLTSPVPTVTVALLICLGQNAIDYTYLSYVQMLGLYAALAVLALLALRLVLHRTLLGDEPGDDGLDDGLDDAPQHTSAARSLLKLTVALAVIVGSTVVLSTLLTPPLANFVCPPDCGRPPIGEPVAVNPRFTSADGAFSVSYPGEGSAYTATFAPDGVSLELHAGDGGSLRLFGEPADGRSPRQIADDVMADAYPEATTDYVIPNAMVGYQPGYGIVADVFKAGSIGADSRLRVLVMVAVKNGLGLIAAAAGRYHEYSPEFGSGHPSGANFFLALDLGKYVNSFTWRGDPVR